MPNRMIHNRGTNSNIIGSQHNEDHHLWNGERANYIIINDVPKGITWLK